MNVLIILVKMMESVLAQRMTTYVYVKMVSKVIIYINFEIFSIYFKWFSIYLVSYF